MLFALRPIIVSVLLKEIWIRQELNKLLTICLVIGTWIIDASGGLLFLDVHSCQSTEAYSQKSVRSLPPSYSCSWTDLPQDRISLLARHHILAWSWRSKRVRNHHIRFVCTFNIDDGNYNQISIRFQEHYR